MKHSISIKRNCKKAKTLIRTNPGKIKFKPKESTLKKNNQLVRKKNKFHSYSSNISWKKKKKRRQIKTLQEKDITLNSHRVTDSQSNCTVSGERSPSLIDSDLIPLSPSRIAIQRRRWKSQSQGASSNSCCYRWILRFFLKLLFIYSFGFLQWI